LDATGYNILLVYRAAEFPLRPSALDHLEWFHAAAGLVDAKASARQRFFVNPRVKVVKSLR
jgi:hypothetical protein